MKKRLGNILEFVYNKPQYIFYFVSAMGIVSFFIIAFFEEWYGHFAWLMMDHTSDYIMSDHIRHMQFAAVIENAYKNNAASFPAMAYCIYFILYKISPMDIVKHDWTEDWKDAPYVIVSYILLVIMISFLFQYIIGKITQLSQKEVMLLCFLLICSLPFFAGAIERGNNAYPVLVILCNALYIKDNEKNYKRELSLVLIAFAAAIKIYPAILGLIYVKEKRWKDCLHLIIYGVIFFFVPFIFTGGVEGLKTYLEHLAYYNDLVITRWMSIRGFCTYIGATERIPGLTIELACVIGRVIEKIFLVVMLIGAFVTKKKWKELFFLTMPMAYYVVNNYRYTAVYLTIPLLYLITDKQREEGHGRVFLMIYYFLFGMVFTIPTWGYMGEPEHWMSGAAFILCVMVLVEEILLIFDIRKNKRKVTVWNKL